MYIAAFVVCMGLEAFTCQGINNTKEVFLTIDSCLEELNLVRPELEAQGLLIVQQGCMKVPGEKV
jgi:hypothetical protein